MIHGILQRRWPLLLVALVLAATIIACGGAPEFTLDQASAMIAAQFRDTEIDLRNVAVDDDGRGVAVGNVDGAPWEFHFRPTDEGSWALESVSIDGALYRIAPEFTVDRASALIAQQWPEAEVDLRNAFVDEEGRGVVFADVEGAPWEFYFQPGQGDEWLLEAVSVDGGLYYIADLEQISETMQLMGEAAGALGRYLAASGSYPEGESPEVLLVLIPDYLAEETQRHDAWGQDFLYESDGADYTLISIGADGEAGTRDDIILHSGEFISAGSRGGRQQQ